MRLSAFCLVIIFTSINLTAQVTQEWVRIYNGGYPEAMAFDHSGNLIETGQSTSGNLSFETINYNTSGTQLWASAFYMSYSCHGYALAPDDSGNVYITGYWLMGNNFPATLIIKYNSTGIAQWHYATIDRMIHSSKTITIDGAGNIYLAVYFVAGGGTTTIDIVKMSPSGSQIWDKYYVTGIPVSIKSVPSGYLYLSGYSGTSGAGTQYTLIKLDTSGTSKWVRNYYSDPSGPNVNTAMTINNSENIFITGFSRKPAGDTDYTTIKYDSSGNIDWSISYGDTTLRNNEPTSIVSDNSGSVYVTGLSRGNGTGVDYATVKYNNNGIQQWIQRYNGVANGDDIANAMTIDNNSNVYVTGSSIGIGTEYDYATIKYNSAGVMQWVIRFNDSVNANDYANAIVTDNSGNVYVAGEGNNEFMTVKYSQPTGINPISSDIPKSYSLSQNYPNPFNPSTKIKFGVPKNGVVHLVIYDAIGREVSTLVNEQLNAGTYEAEWNALNFPSGVYFSKLVSGDYSETKKLVLVK